MNNRDVVLTSFLAFVSSFEATMILTAIPEISAYFGITHFEASFLVAIYVAIEALLFVPFAIVFERISLKIGMISGGVLLVIGGILIFFSSTFLEMEIFRVIQALGASIIMPTSLAYASSIGDDARRGHAIGINHTIVSLGYVIGLPIGGLIILFNWKILFLISSTLALIILIFILTVNDIKSVSTIGIKVLGPSLMLSGIVLLALNIWLAIAATLFGLVTSLRTTLPKEYVKSSISGFIHSITRNAFAAFLVFFYSRLGYTSLQYGLLILLYPLSFTFVSLAAGKASDRFGRKLVSILGFVAMAIFSLSIFINSILAEILLGMASGIATTSNTSYTMNSLEKENRIVGSALRTLQGTVSMSLGLSLGSIISIVPENIVMILVVLNFASVAIALFYKKEK